MAAVLFGSVARGDTNSRSFGRAGRRSHGYAYCNGNYPVQAPISPGRGPLQPLGTLLATPPGSPPGASTVLIPIVRVSSLKPIPIHPLHADSFPFHFHHASLSLLRFLAERKPILLHHPTTPFLLYIHLASLFTDKLSFCCKMDKIKEVSFSLQNPLVRRGSWQAAVPEHTHMHHIPTLLLPCQRGYTYGIRKYGIIHSRPDGKWKKKANGKDLENEHPPLGG